jgi:ribosomal protein S18 acetylase RimI-like enzyme
MTTLDAMTDSEFAAFADEAPQDYARDQVEAGIWPANESVRLARDAFSKLLPQGLVTPDHFLYVVREESTRAALGVLWYALKDRAGERVAYVYGIHIKDEFRRMGHATRTLAALERKARSQGLAGIELHVFGRNAKARALYDKVGFHETNVTMFKPLGAR